MPGSSPWPPGVSTGLAHAGPFVAIFSATISVLQVSVEGTHRPPLGFRRGAAANRGLHSKPGVQGRKRRPRDREGSRDI